MNLIETIFWLAINLYHEGRNQPIEGQKAICHVVLNRAKKKKKTVKEIIYEKSQFSWTLDKNLWPIKEYEAFLQAATIAKETIEEQSNGFNLDNAEYYHTKSVNPKRNDKLKIVKVIQDHIFYKI